MFNLEDFKKYGKAVRRDGKIARFIAHIPDAAHKDMCVLSILVGGELRFNSEDGAYLLGDTQSDSDLIDVVRPMLNVSFSVPEPMSEEPAMGDTVYIISGNVYRPHVASMFWGKESPEFRSIVWGQRFVWRTREDAQAVVDILKKGFRQ